MKVRTYGSQVFYLVARAPPTLLMLQSVHLTPRRALRSNLVPPFIGSMGQLPHPRVSGRNTFVANPPGRESWLCVVGSAISRILCGYPVPIKKYPIRTVLTSCS